MRTTLLIACLILACITFFNSCTSDGEAKVTITVYSGNSYQGGSTKAQSTAIDNYIYDQDDPKWAGTPECTQNPTTGEEKPPKPDTVSSGWFTFNAETADIGNILNFVVLNAKKSDGTEASIQLAVFNQHDNLICYSDRIDSALDFVFGIVDEGPIYIYIGTVTGNLDSGEQSSAVTFNLETATYKGPSYFAFDFAVNYDFAGSVTADQPLQGAGLYIFDPFESKYGIPMNIASQTLADQTFTNSTVVKFSKGFDFSGAGTYMMTVTIMSGQATANVMNAGSLFFGIAGSQTTFDPIIGCFVVNAFDITGGTGDRNNAGYKFDVDGSLTFNDIWQDLGGTLTAGSYPNFLDIPKVTLSTVIPAGNLGVVKLASGSYNFAAAPTKAGSEIAVAKKDTQYSMSELMAMYPAKAVKTRLPKKYR